MKWFDISKDEWDLWSKEVNRIMDSYVIDHTIFEKYKIVGGDDVDSEDRRYLIYLQNIAIVFNNYPDIKSEVFNKDSKVSVDSVYQYAYHLALETSCSMKYEDLLRTTGKIISTISPVAIIDNPLLQTHEVEVMTEFEVYEALSCSPISVTLMLLNAINASQSVIQELKKTIINRNCDSFIQCVLQNEISFENIYPYLSSLLVLSTLKDTASFIAEAVDGKFNRDITDFKTFYLKEDVQLQRLFTELKHRGKSFIDYFENIPQNINYNNWWKSVYCMTAWAQILSASCPDYSLIQQYKSLIENDDFLKRIVERYNDIATLNELNSINFVIPAIEEFRRKYITELAIPASVGNPKDEHLRFSGNKIWHDVEMQKLYRTLVDKGFISWDTETYFSFMYRMSADYKPAQADIDKMLTPIVWNGTVRELLSIVYFLHESDTQKWKKCGLFFVDTHGNTLNIPSGCKNMAVNPPDIINNILSDRAYR